jgi:hypothetical protein
VAATVTITGGGTAFSPATVTVQAGQPVCWTWQTSTPHNVRADSGAFGSGDPVTDGTFQVTYDGAGTYGYHCQVHGSPTGGMRGTVIVAATDGGGGGESGPGTLRFLVTAMTVNEGDGNAVLTVERAGGSDGAASVSYTTANGSAKQNRDFGRAKGKLTWTNGDSAPKTITIPLRNDTAREAAETFRVRLSKPTGAPLATAEATVTINDDDTPGCGAAALAAPADLRAAGESASEVRVDWSEEPATAHAVHVERRAAGGDFVEVAIVAAGIGSFVDGGLPAGSSFDYRLRSASVEGLSAYSDVVAAATDGETGPCRDGELCLLDGRFAATLAWRGERGQPRPAAAARLGEAEAAAGLFMLGEAPAVLLSVTDDCEGSGRFAIALAGLADAELRVQVRDTLSGRTWAHLGGEGDLVALHDADALAVCP